MTSGSQASYSEELKLLLTSSHLPVKKCVGGCAGPSYGTVSRLRNTGTVRYLIPCRYLLYVYTEQRQKL